MSTAHKFTDSADRDWRIKITVDTIENVRVLGVDLGDITAETMKRLVMDDVLLVRSLWIICEEQADKEEVNPKQFGEGLVGDCLDDAYEALRGALEDFFPKRKREFFARMMDVEGETQAEAMRLGIEALESEENRSKLSEAMRERVKTEMTNALRQLGSATDSPGLSE